MTSRTVPHGTREAIRQALAATREHARRIEQDALELDANVPSPLVAALHQAPAEPLDVVEASAAAALARVMRAVHADVRPAGAGLATLAGYTAFTQPGDTIAVLPDWAGGQPGPADARGLQVVALPYDIAALDVDIGALPAFFALEHPALVVVGGSLMLFPHRLAAIAEVVHAHGATLLYDASHSAGLIAEGRFQDPLEEGADVLTLSTATTLGGASGGALVSRDAALAGAVSGDDAPRLLPLLAAVLERERSDGAYADQCIANARRLAAELDAAGLTVLGAHRGFTASHQVALDARTHGGGPAAALRLAAANLLVAETGVPRDPAGGLRIGTQALTRQGFGEEDMAPVAAACAAILRDDAPPERVRRDVAAIRRRHSGLRWCLTLEELEQR